MRIQGGKQPNPRYDNNRYGAQVGGPIKKDKLFYFANYERQTTGQAGQYFLCTPTAAGLTALADPGLNFSQTNLGEFHQVHAGFAEPGGRCGRQRML